MPTEMQEQRITPEQARDLTRPLRHYVAGACRDERFVVYAASLPAAIAPTSTVADPVGILVEIETHLEEQRPGDAHIWRPLVDKVRSAIEDGAGSGRGEPMSDATPQQVREADTRAVFGENWTASRFEAKTVVVFG